MWPNNQSGPILEAPGDTWVAIDKALRHGNRGLPGGSSLFQLLNQHFHVEVHRRRPPWSIPQILTWADAHHSRTGEWPTKRSGSVQESPGTSWMMVQAALAAGKRGLPGESSLGKLLLEHRGVRQVRRARLDSKQILKWAHHHRRRSGKWPTSTAGKIKTAPRLTWLAVDMALRHGNRGLPGGSSLSLLIRTNLQ